MPTLETPPPLASRTAVVTGALRGIGRAIAIELAKTGADVLVHCKADVAAAKETAAEIERLGRASHVVALDLAEQGNHEVLVDAAWQWRGDVDLWINNAGVDVLTGEAADWSFEEKLAALWQVDVTATMRLSRLAGTRMKAAGSGAIVNIGWDQAEQGMEGDSGEMFAAVKGAVMAFTRSLAKSLAPQVRVNCVAPGWIKTSWGETASDYWQHRATEESLLRRWGTPQDIARAVAFLCTDASDFITGQTIAVNGGRRGVGEGEAEWS